MERDRQRDRDSERETERKNIVQRNTIWNGHILIIEAVQLFPQALDYTSCPKGPALCIYCEIYVYLTTFDYVSLFSKI